MRRAGKRSRGTRLGVQVIAAATVLATVAGGCSSDDSGSGATGATTAVSAPSGSSVPASGPTTSTPVDRPATLGLTGDITGAHDPDIAREGDWYYVFLTGAGVPVRRSRDLVHWEAVGSVFEGPRPAWMDLDWTEDGDGVGAPDVEWFGGRWHLYYHSHQFATNNAVTGHASTASLDPDHPDHGWVDDGLIMSSTIDDGHSVLDANAVVDGDGVPWLSFGSFWEGINLVELDVATGAPVTGAPFTLLAARDPWVLGLEATSIARRDGWWYLFASWGFCCQGVDTQYEIRVGRSRDLAGPYLDAAGTPLLEGGGSLVVGGHGRVRGPGSGDVLDDEGTFWLVHHWYDAEADGETTLGVRPLLWSGDGWPAAADPGFVAAPSGSLAAGDLVGTWVLSQHLDGQEVTLSLAADGVLADDLGTWSFDAVSALLAIELDAPCGALVGASHAVVVDATARAGHGWTSGGGALRAERAVDVVSAC